MSNEWPSDSAQVPRNETGNVVDIAAVIDAKPVSRFQIGVMVLVGLSVVMEGFDVQAMGFVAPSIIQAWGVSRAAMGPVFAASLVGLLIGSLILGPVADRVGRRPVLIGATACLSLCMLATSFAMTLPQLLALRFVTGLVMGGIMGNAIALVSEYSPARRRATLVMWVSCGFTGGAVLGGVVSAVLIARAGWQAVFLFGGAIPLLVAAAMFVYLPESMHFLALRRRELDRVGLWLRRIAPELDIDARHHYRVPESQHRGMPIGALFTGSRARVTLLLWGINFMNLLNLFFLASWLPTIAIDAGYDVPHAAVVGTLLQIGGVIGTITLGPLIDRWGFFRVLVPCYLLAAVAIAAIGQTAHVSFELLITCVTISGFGIVGGQPANNTISASAYPTALRGTGVSWSLGIGRAGSIVGPWVAGNLMQLHWSSGALFLAAAIPALLSSAMLMVLSRNALFGAPPAAGEVKLT